MKKFFLISISWVAIITFSSCSGGNEKLNSQEETEVNGMMKKDQEKMDSMKRVLEEKYQTIKEE
ncbi:MAG: hypothetical protein LC109_06060 [Bacteroidia bacterium]|nr:hypothetical protein [Bacteroidia bacterium]